MNEHIQRPAWMEDDLVKNIPPKKLDFLSRMFEKGQGKSQKELMGMMMPMMQQARKENLTFTMQEMNAAIAAIKKYSNTEELEKINNILDKTAQNRK